MFGSELLNLTTSLWPPSFTISKLVNRLLKYNFTIILHPFNMIEAISQYSVLMEAIEAQLRLTPEALSLCSCPYM